VFYFLQLRYTPTHPFGASVRQASAVGLISTLDTPMLDDHLPRDLKEVTTLAPSHQQLFRGTARI